MVAQAVAEIGIVAGKNPAVVEGVTNGNLWNVWRGVRGGSEHVNILFGRLPGEGS